MQEPNENGMIEVGKAELIELIAKANKLTEMMSQAEVRHGGLLGVDAMRAANELRLELSRWK